MTLSDAEFRERWVAYVDELDLLRSNLTDGQAEVLDDAQEQLNALVDVATEQRGDDE